MEEELYEDITAVVSDGYSYGFQSRGHLISVAADELLRDRGYYSDVEDDELNRSSVSGHSSKSLLLPVVCGHAWGLIRPVGRYQ